jgi:NRPS condensation-like uncharacterized protein
MKTQYEPMPAWLKLDNAAKIYPAARSREWTATFRMSVTLKEDIDPQLLKKALKATLKRIPSFACRLRRGFFWYYLERLPGAPAIQPDVANPLVRMDMKANRHFMFRLRYFDKRIAVEIFHALADGTGGLTFLLTLVKEYLRLKNGAAIPSSPLILDLGDTPKPEEWEDSFIKYSRGVASSRREEVSYRIRGTDADRHYLNLITGIIPTKELNIKAKASGVSITVFLTALLIHCILAEQQKEHSKKRLRQPVKVSVPVNLRNFYPSPTLRNFSSYINVGVRSAYGWFTFDEILVQVKHTLGLELNEKTLNARFSANVNAEKIPIIRMMPLFLKTPLLKVFYRLQGDRYCSTTFSNLGLITVPEEMTKYIARIDFILGPPQRNALSCACSSYGGQTYVSFSGIIKETGVQRGFFTNLVRMGIPVRIESNRRD